MIKTGKIVLKDSTTGSVQEYELGVGRDPKFDNVANFVCPSDKPVLVANKIEDKLVIEKVELVNPNNDKLPNVTATVIDFGKDWEHVEEIEV